MTAAFTHETRVLLGPNAERPWAMRKPSLLNHRAYSFPPMVTPLPPSPNSFSKKGAAADPVGFFWKNATMRSMLCWPLPPQVRARPATASGTGPTGMTVCC